MIPGSIEILGTLRTDGSLALDSKPDLPAGRVRVRIQGVNAPPTPAEALANLEAIWAERDQRKIAPRTAEEIDADLNALRDEWEDHQLALEKIQEDARRAREGPGC
jgi:hypothetical protein